MITSVRSNLYDILGVSSSASIDDIKSAFRKAALQHHPDRNDNSPESAARFRFIYNAYGILSDPKSRRDYDVYLRISSVFSGSAADPVHQASDRLPRPMPGGHDARATLLGHLSCVLWDIEDLIRAKPDWNRAFGDLSLRNCVLKMLSFIDRWVLEATGFPDYFFQARRMKAPSTAEALLDGTAAGHRPFVDLEDYFYNIRLRTNRFLEGMRLLDLLGCAPGTDLRLVDCVLEAHNLCFYYLGCVQQALAGEIERIPAFRHTDPRFDV